MNNSKPLVICIFGFMATGKLTIGRALSEETKIKLSHNHLLNDFVDSLFDGKTAERFEITEGLRFTTLEKSVLAGNSVILTHAYSSNFISPTGRSGKAYVEKLEKIVNEAGGLFLGVHLFADENDMYERCQFESRSEFKKLQDPEKMKKIFQKDGEQERPSIENYLVLNTSDLSVENSVKEVLVKFKELE